VEGWRLDSPPPDHLLWLPQPGSAPAPIGCLPNAALDRSLCSWGHPPTRAVTVTANRTCPGLQPATESLARRGDGGGGAGQGRAKDREEQRRTEKSREEQGRAGKSREEQGRAGKSRRKAGNEGNTGSARAEAQIDRLPKGEVGAEPFTRSGQCSGSCQVCTPLVLSGLCAPGKPGKPVGTCHAGTE
jgi:hypothetical protein